MRDETMTPIRIPIPPAGEHGGDGHKLARTLGLDPSEILDLSASLNPLAPDARRVVARHLDSLGRYPDAGAATAALAEVIGVEKQRLLLTNGAAEAIALVATELGTASVAEPEFSLYRRHLRAVDPRAPVLRSNPNNPTGLLAAPLERADVWDEAFYQLATGRWTRGDPGSTVVGSLTKLLACPGLRLGYVIAPDEDLARRLSSRQPRWSVNGPAVDSLPELLFMADLEAWAARISGLRADLAEVLKLHGLSARPSQANFVLVDAAGDLRAQLASEGVFVRDCASFGLPDCVRIAVPGPDGLERFERALARVRDRAVRVTP